MFLRYLGLQESTCEENGKINSLSRENNSDTVVARAIYLLRRVQKCGEEKCSLNWLVLDPFPETGLESTGLQLDFDP